MLFGIRKSFDRLIVASRSLFYLSHISHNEIQIYKPININTIIYSYQRYLKDNEQIEFIDRLVNDLLSDFILYAIYKKSIR